ncbi:MAG: MlaD family protein [Planctomycetaceae bacterium]|nr:MlaD family protein [Planctomycetaceae bacterium]
MDSQHIKIRIGIVCVGFLIATVILVMLFGGGKMRLFSSDYEIYVLLKQAPMLSENSPVYKNGVAIGRVTRVQLVDEDRMVEITARINSNIKLYTNEDCNLSLNLLGQSTLNFSPRADEPLGEMLAAQSRIHGVTPIDLMRVADDLQSDASKALRSATGVADEMKAALGIINQILGAPEEVAQKQQKIEEMVEQAAETMTLVNSVLTSVNELISDLEMIEGIRTSSTQLPDIIREGKTLMAKFNEMSDQIAPLLQKAEGAIGKFDQNLDNISQFTEALGENGPQIAEALTAAAQEFEGGLAQLSEFARSLNNPDGSIGQLLNDPEFFQSLNSTIRNADRTIKNIERITVQLQPILQDVNVFTDKIAREPGQLGLRGLFDRSPPTKGIPDAYANSWQPARFNGIPQQQSERIQFIRPRNWPFGMQQYQYRNEPVPVQNRYATQVTDLPDSPYDDTNFRLQTSGFGFHDGAAMPTPEAQYPEFEARNLPMSYQTPQIVPHNRVVIVPVQAVSLQASDFKLQASENGPNTIADVRNPRHEIRSGTTLEIDFTPEETSPVRLASGNISAAPPIIQPLHGKSEQIASQENRIAEATVKKPERRTEIKVPNFQPTF